jgi:hypothetical protein
MYGYKTRVYFLLQNSKRIDQSPAQGCPSSPYIGERRLTGEGTLKVSLLP